jgi:polysaccharide biosynthesis protein PslH
MCVSPFTILHSSFRIRHSSFCIFHFPLNLLFLTPQLPFPPRQGTAIRNWGLIKHLAQRHAITLLSFTEPDQTPVPAELQAVCARVVTVPMPHRTRADRLRTLFSSQADLARRLWSEDFAHALTTLLRESAFDLVQLEGLELASYLPFLTHQESGVRHTKLLYDAHNAEYLIQRRAFSNDLRLPARWPAALYSLSQTRRLKKFEAETCCAADGVTCVSKEDAEALQRLAPALKPVIVPNGIDLADYQAQRTSRNIQAGAKLVFTGKMDYRPNIDAAAWFIEAIWPRIRAVRPETQFFVVGQKPPEKLRRLNGRNGVVVTGAVDDTRPYIAEAAVYVAPLRMGGGTRFKLLEAMALARPIVSTTLGAEGFDVRSGQELLLADTPAEFAAAALKLLDTSTQAEVMALAGLAFARASYDWSVIIPRLEAAYHTP